MFWIMGAALLTAVLLPILGWHWKHRKTLSLVCGLLAGVMVLCLLISYRTFTGGAFGGRAENLDLIGLLVLGPPCFAAVLGLSSILLLRDWRWRVGMLGWVV
jgi:hypothetical protein